MRSRPIAATSFVLNGLLRAIVAVGLFVVGCDRSGPLEPARFVREIPWAERGIWLKADTHVHTNFSDGALPLTDVVTRARLHGVDVLAITDHADSELKATSDEYFAALALARAENPEMIILAGLEWNVPPWGGREHATLLVSPASDEKQLLREFQRSFDDWQQQDTDPNQALHALGWLEKQAATPAELPVVIYNHPNRKRETGHDLVAELARLQSRGPVLVGFEGGPGHQNSKVIGSYSKSRPTVDRWDPAVAEVGGEWDQLLAEHVPIWGALATSDLHSGDPEKADCFWPGQFSETWLYAPERSAAGALAALRAGSFFAAHGHIVRQVELTAMAGGLTRPAIAGEAVYAPAGTVAMVTLRLETPSRDWKRDENRLDQVELITISESGAMVAAQQLPLSGTAMHVPIAVPPGGVTLRARGRRVVPDGEDLLFYTNPIQFVTDPAAVASTGATYASSAKPSLPTVSNVAVSKAGTAGTAAATAAAGRDERSFPAWIPLLFVLAGGLLVTLMDRWSLEVRRRFFRNRSDSHTIEHAPSAPRRYLAVPLLLAIFLAVYGSLVPLNVQEISWDAATERFREVLQTPLNFASRTDWATNVLLFVPIGFFATGLLFGNRPSDRRRGLGVVLIVCGCAVLSLAIEFAQLWVVDRTTSQNDIVAESFGGLVGAFGWVLFGRTLLQWLGRFLSATRPREHVERMLEAYLVIVGTYMLMPLDLTLRPAEIYGKWKSGQINLIPLADIASNPNGAIELIGDTLLLVPLGMLVALWRWPQYTDVRPLVRALATGLLIMIGIELAQVFVQSRYSSTTDLLTGMLGVGLGWGIARWLVRRKARVGPRVSRLSGSTAVLLSAVAVYSIILTAVFCLPFDDWARGEQISQRFTGLFTRPPLAAFYTGTELNAVSEMLRKTLLFAPLGGLLALAIHSRPQTLTNTARSRSRDSWLAGRGWLVAAGIGGAALLALVIEVAQVWLLPHVPDMTDVILCTLGSSVGLAAAVRVLAARDEPTSAAAHSVV
ncbi:MAG: VanZ family protein [Pirellulaceae bacterium]|nr:VanZ family protein [Pirellulaceae bacterium]